MFINGVFLFLSQSGRIYSSFSTFEKSAKSSYFLFEEIQKLNKKHRIVCAYFKTVEKAAKNFTQKDINQKL
jgi:hypothetical protein